MRYLALDVGDRRVGIATGDSSIRLATPVDVIERSTIARDSQAIVAAARRYGAEELIVGLPKNMDGTVGPQAEAAKAYGDEIGRVCNLPVIYWDERLSTAEAMRRTHETGGRGKKARRSLDAIAAAVILQDFLDAHARGSQESDA